ncbi:HNH endonuclease [Alistipes communis]|uniref:HNH endonuclease n=1 Tax=Alistipes communis TaxID=2585118 RepID=UPI0029438342|nr:HNH endonuclease [Alistipes communis]
MSGRLCGRSYSLEIHHKTYYVDGQSIVGREKEHLDCLITLCAECHQKQHNHHGQAK